MARIRTIKPEFWTAGQVLECSTNARLLFIGLWTFCDDKGRHTFSTKSIKAEIFPADTFASDDILGMLKELSTNGLIVRYAVDGKEYLQVTGWHHQRIDKPQKPKYPGPVEDCSGNDPGTAPERSRVKGKDTIRAAAARVREADEAAAAAAAEEYEEGRVLLAAYVECEARIFAEQKRPWPMQTDRRVARLWAAEGITAERLIAVVEPILWRRQRAGEPPPKTLAYFEEPLHAKPKPNGAVAKDGADWDWEAQGEREDGLWRLRLKAWCETRAWLHEWGPEPDKPGTLVPPELLPSEQEDAIRKVRGLKPRHEATA